MSWRRLTSSFSAGAWPRPFWVSTCTTIGPSYSAAWREGLLHALDVVAVEGPRVAHAEVLEERRRLEHLAHRGHEPVEALLELVADHRHVVEQAVEAGPVAEVGGVEAQAGEAVAELRHGGGVGPAVVVEHDDRLLARVPEVVEPLEGHPAGERAVADHGHDPPAVAELVLLRDREAVGVADDRGRVAVLDPVVLRLGPRTGSRTARRPGAGWRSRPPRPVSILCT